MTRTDEFKMDDSSGELRESASEEPLAEKKKPRRKKSKRSSDTTMNTNSDIGRDGVPDVELQFLIDAPTGRDSSRSKSKRRTKSKHSIETTMHNNEGNLDGVEEVERQSSRRKKHKKKKRRSKSRESKSKGEKVKKRRLKKKDYLQQQAATQTTVETNQTRFADDFDDEDDFDESALSLITETTFKPRYSEVVVSEGLCESTYSLIFTASWRSLAFAFALGIFAFQQSILWILLFDLFDFTELVDDFGENPFQLPPGVPTQVTAAQGLAMVLAVAIQDDLIVAIIDLVGGRPNVGDADEDVSRDLSTTSISWPHKNKISTLKWNVSRLLQLSSGFILMLVIFLLTMQEESVKNVCVNFAALMFIAEIDEIAFKLASFGFMTNAIQDQCKKVKQFTVEKSIKNKRKEHIWYRLLILCYCIILFGGFAYLVQLQTSGAFVCQTIFLQFGDTINPPAALYSGLYYLQESRVGDRSRYVDFRGTVQIGYCLSEKIWTVSVFTGDDTDDICNNFLAKTEETDSFDITELESSMWKVLNFFDHQNFGVSPQFIPFDLISITCNECDDACSPGDGECIAVNHISARRDFETGVALSRGVTSDVCQCKRGRFGVNCEFPPSCKKLVTDRRLEPFTILDADSAIGAKAIKVETIDKPFLLSNITIDYRAPLYYTENGYISLFLGRRWGVTQIQNFFDPSVSHCFRQNDIFGEDSKIENIEKLLDCSKDYFENIFHPAYSNYSIYYISDPMDYLTASDDGEPDEYRWYRTPKFNALFWDSHPGPSLLCAECTDFTNQCENFGVCGEVEPGVCECPIGTAGSLCELQENCADRLGVCYNGGTCNEWSGDCECLDEFYGSLCQYRYSNDTGLLL